MYQLHDASGTCTRREPDVAFLKLEVAHMLRVHHNTITAWDAIAFFRIPHYRKCYEVQPGKFNRRMPLARYQVWVLQRIQKLFKRLKNADRVRQYLTAYPQEFTVQAWRAGSVTTNPTI